MPYYFKTRKRIFLHGNFKEAIALRPQKCYNQHMDEETKVKVRNLISLRQSLLGLLPILVGGTLGLLFIKGYFAIRIILFPLGFLLFTVLMKSLHSTICELNQYLYGKNKEKQ